MTLLRMIYRSMVFVAALLPAVIGGCSTSGDDPIGSLLGSTSQSIQYWQITSRQFQRQAVRSLTIGENDILIASVHSQGVFLSSDEGKTWTEYSEGLPEEPDILRVRDAKGGVLYAISDTGVYRRYSAAEQWEPFTEGLPAAIALYEIKLDVDKTPYLATSNGLYMLAAGDTSWISITNGLPRNTAITTMDFLPNRKAAALDINGNIYRSNDGVGGWVPVYLPFYIDSAYSVTLNPTGDLCILMRSRRLVVFRHDQELEMNQRIFAGEIRFYNGIGFLRDAVQKSSDPYSNDERRYGVMRSVDGGLNWAPMYSGLSAQAVDLVFDSEGNGYAASSDGVMHKTLTPVK